MFPFKKKEDRGNISATNAIAILLATLALAVALGAARWSWYMIDELVQLRQDFNDLKNQQDQLKIQFDFWDQKVSAERSQLRMMWQQQQQPNVNGGGTKTPTR